MMHDKSEAADGVPEIGADELRPLVEANKAFLLDVRRAARGEQIYGAIRYDPRKLGEAPRLVLPLPKDGTPVVLYDEAGDSQTLRRLGAKLRENGYESGCVLSGGFDAWKAADGKMEEPTLEQPVPMVSEHQAER